MKKPANRRPGWSGVAALAAALSCLSVAPARAQESGAAAVVAPRGIDLLEFRVEGADHLSQADVESAVGPFLGPGRVLEDVERAREALEKRYADRGYHSVAVAIPPQTVRNGVVVLQVTEGRVGRLRVRGARWHSPWDIERQAPSVAEGTVPNFDAIVRDLVALNQLPDRRVTPALRAGMVPGTVDVDLDVKDRLPLHGSLELNNRQSASTTNLRLSGALRYENLWQRGHALNLAFQLSPRQVEEGKVLSTSYLARFAGAPWLTLTAMAVVQDSDVSTLGDIGVAGRGRIYGGRATFTLPGSATFFHSITAGLDYKRFQERISLGESALSTPVTYWPLTTQYGAGWAGRRAQTQLGVTITANLRGPSSDTDAFRAKRFQASGNFMHWRGDLSRTDELIAGAQLYTHLLGQYSREPLLGSEQLTAGGADSIRGYLEVQAAGDYGAIGTVELRTPSLSRWLGHRVISGLRLLAFAEGGRVAIHAPPPDQDAHFPLWSAGFGSRLQLLQHLNASIDVGVPFTGAGDTRAHEPRVHFRISTDL